MSNDNIEIRMDGQSTNLSDGIARGIYVLMRKCPHAHEALGHKDVWSMSSREFLTVCEMFCEEVEETKKHG